MRNPLRRFLPLPSQAPGAAALTTASVTPDAEQRPVWPVMLESLSLCLVITAVSEVQHAGFRTKTV